MTEINFEYFDPEVELCTFDEQGRPIRPRKKPGRKPNPPTPAQRKAQNRAAQRAFRERKRREMRDNEVNIKKCLHQRDQAIRKAHTLQRTIKQLRYENNYLKGCLLTLKLACFSHGINVPKFWNTGETDAVGADILSLSKTEGIPQCLEFFLDNNMHIISKSPEFLSTTTDNTTIPSTTGSTGNSNGTWTNGYHPPQTKSTSITTCSPISFNKNDNNNTMINTSSYSNSLMDPPQNYQQQQSILDDISRLDPSLYSSVIMPDFITHSLSSPTLLPPLQQQQQLAPSYTTNDILALLNLTPKSTSTTTATTYWPLSGTQSSPSSSTTPQPMNQHPKPSSSDISHRSFPPMAAIDAINYLRRMNRNKPFEQSIFTPTELQKAVSHDARIDSVPGPLIRDHMILFQGYYDANALFSFLIKHSRFLGGELGNSDCWFVPPTFFQTYWFLMPNHRPRRMDNAIEIAVTQGRTLSRMMFQRKKMYLEREKFADYFPPLHLSDHSDDDDDDDEEEDRPADTHLSDGDPWETTMTNDDVVRTDDIPLDMVMNMMDTLPKLSPANGFNF
ncbi:hypothetical protein BC941DRAFT_424684 [Chlamydoabsidia padenii]|nr:hypothetical protein BC941DRAFT_424684 [Chlamydoabsidia padenii]